MLHSGGPAAIRDKTRGYLPSPFEVDAGDQDVPAPLAQLQA